ncbi:MAG: MBL fold metallo-hydrolase [Candidatus Jidaibacter sp.]|jgi:L-ascorbate metabolism protein UlaG (beta-lactamase superfamily)|nr:MBL fold metallo-hydrolase [Candidatus Jidaibacter sp.]
MKITAFVLLFVSIILTAGYWYLDSVTYYKGEKTDHFDGKVFFNPYDKVKNRFSKFLKWRMNRNPAPWPDYLEVENYDAPPPTFEGGIRASYVGHATVLLQVDGINILTDPVFSKRVGPFGMGPKRVIDPGVKLEDLPKIDVVLISHNHYDHMDKATIKTLVARDNPKFITPLGNDAIIKSFTSKANVESLDWFQSIELDSLVINVMPALHWSSRFVLDRNKALWSSFVVETSAGNIYFAGDSGYGSGTVYEAIRDKFGDIKLALIPVGTYEPRDFMMMVHNNPDDAMRAFRLINAEYGMAIHHSVFQLSDESIEQQHSDFIKALEESDVSPKNFKMLKVGEPWVVE